MCISGETQSVIHCKEVERTGKDRIMTSMQCDVCKKDYLADDAMEIQEFHRVGFTGGYSSVFGDSTTVRCDICQHCLKRMIEKYMRLDEGSYPW